MLLAKIVISLCIEMHRCPLIVTHEKIKSQLHVKFCMAQTFTYGHHSTNTTCALIAYVSMVTNIPRETATTYIGCTVQVSPGILATQ